MAIVTRKQLIFDVDTKVAAAILGETKYRKLYVDIEKHMKSYGFERIEYSSYESIQPVSKVKVSQLMRDLLRKYPYLTKCIRDTRETTVIDGRSLNAMLDYDGTPGKFAQYDSKQNNSKASMLQKFENKKQEAKKTNSDRQVNKNKEQSHNKSSR